MGMYSKKEIKKCCVKGTIHFKKMSFKEIENQEKKKRKKCSCCYLLNLQHLIFFFCSFLSLSIISFSAFNNFVTSSYLSFSLLSTNSLFSICKSTNALDIFNFSCSAP